MTRPPNARSDTRAACRDYQGNGRYPVAKSLVHHTDNDAIRHIEDLRRHHPRAWARKDSDGRRGFQHPVSGDLPESDRCAREDKNAFRCQHTTEVAGTQGRASQTAGHHVGPTPGKVQHPRGGKKSMTGGVGMSRSCPATLRTTVLSMTWHRSDGLCRIGGDLVADADGARCDGRHPGRVGVVPNGDHPRRLPNPIPDRPHRCRHRRLCRRRGAAPGDAGSAPAQRVGAGHGGAPPWDQRHGPRPARRQAAHLDTALPRCRRAVGRGPRGSHPVSRRHRSERSVGRGRRSSRKGSSWPCQLPDPRRADINLR